MWANGLIYVDAFSGPWNSVDPNLNDSSFAIAVNQLRIARSTVAERFHRKLSLKCIFLESDKTAFQQLNEFSLHQNDVDITVLNDDFEQTIPKLVSLVTTIRHRSGGTWFPFIFIDPQGWTGFSMELITPLIQLEPCELLVNFMTSHIARFVQDDRRGIKSSFRKLFGDDSYERRIEYLSGKEREDEIVFAYADRIKEVGRYPFVSVTIVLNPTKDRSHFHLIYATRDLKGVEVFKEAERKALKLSEVVRSDAKRRSREESTGQLELFSGDELPDIGYLEELRDHYQRKAANAMLELTQGRSEIVYDEIYAKGLRFPTIQEPFVRQWIRDNGGLVDLPPQKREPKIKLGIRVRFEKQR